jgi:hypothetical protein
VVRILLTFFSTAMLTCSDQGLWPEKSGQGSQTVSTSIYSVTRLSLSMWQTQHGPCIALLRSSELPKFLSSGGRPMFTMDCDVDVDVSVRGLG